MSFSPSPLHASLSILRDSLTLTKEIFHNISRPQRMSEYFLIFYCLWRDGMPLGSCSVSQSSEMPGKASLVRNYILHVQPSVPIQAVLPKLVFLMPKPPSRTRTHWNSPPSGCLGQAEWHFLFWASMKWIKKAAVTQLKGIPCKKTDGIQKTDNKIGLFSQTSQVLHCRPGERESDLFIYVYGSQ